jgi:ABC-type glutathione transport system ATPase component
MLKGKIVETGSTETIFAAPAHPYTRRLLASIPRIEAAAAAPEPQLKEVRSGWPILTSDKVSRFFPNAHSMFGRLFDRSGKLGLAECSLDVAAGELLGIVGESGSGKTTLARMLVGLDSPTEGEVRYKGRSLKEFRAQDWREYRRSVQMVFQGAQTSLNPRKTIRRLFSEAMETAEVPGDRRRSPGELLEMVQLPTDFVARYPHELSGGQRQRVGIARALAMSPEVLIADEPTSALDVSVQKDIIELLAGIQRESGMTMLVVSHDLGLVGSICNRTIVMRRGHIVETGPTRSVLLAPQHAYTRQLIEAVPRGLAGREKYRSAKLEYTDQGMGSA